MIKVQKREEISFAFTVAGWDWLFIQSWGMTGQIRSVRGSFLPAKPHPQPLNSKSEPATANINNNNSTRFILPSVFPRPCSGLKHLHPTK